MNKNRVCTFCVVLAAFITGVIFALLCINAFVVDDVLMDMGKMYVEGLMDGYSAGERDFAQSTFANWEYVTDFEEYEILIERDFKYIEWDRFGNK